MTLTKSTEPESRNSGFPVSSGNDAIGGEEEEKTEEMWKCCGTFEVEIFCYKWIC
jgi:hypothetical protein